MDPERMEVYLESLYAEDSDPAYLRKIEQKARHEAVPIIRPATKTFLKMLLTLKRPRRILEVGCAVGYSALVMHEASPRSEIVTMERDTLRADEAAEHFSALMGEAEVRREPFGLVRHWPSKIQEAGSLSLITGEADDILPRLDGVFDLIFMDAAKGQYLLWLPEIKRLLAPGGVLVSDNILREGDILESHYAVERRNRTIYKRMRAYLYELTHDDGLVTSILSDGDGLAVTVKKP